MQHEVGRYNYVSLLHRNRRLWKVEHGVAHFCVVVRLRRGAVVSEENVKGQNALGIQ